MPRSNSDGRVDACIVQADPSEGDAKPSRHQARKIGRGITVSIVPHPKHNRHCCVRFEMDSAFLSIREERDRSDCLDIETFCSRIQHERGFDGVSDMGLKSYSRWYDYSRARDEMFLATDTSWAPWYVVHSDDKRRARLNALTHILSKIPYEELPRAKVKLPKREKPRGYKESDYPFRVIPEAF